jgi:hypothetical protein
MDFRPLALVPLLVGCGRTAPAAPDAAPDAAPAALSVPPRASEAPPAASSSAPVLQEPPDASDDGPYLSGAAWVTCKDGFRAESSPERDLYRLGLLCGPNLGLHREGEMARGALKQGASHRFSFPAKREQCFRVMATWETSLQRLGLRVLDPAGTQVAHAESDVRWLMAEPQGVFCVERAGDYQVELRAEQGEGKFAAQVWMLR